MTALLSLIALFVLGAFPLGAQAEIKGKVAEVCPSGALGGQCINPQGIAINAAGVGDLTPGEVNPGDFYVADRANQRIQQFSASGAFVRAFGLDVVQSGPANVTPANSVQSISVPASVTAGIFRLSFNGQSTGGLGAANLTEGSNVVTNLIAAQGAGNLTANSPTLTGLSTTLGKFLVGQPVSGPGIPAGTTIISASGSTLTLSANATATASGVAVSSIGPRPFAVGQVIVGAGIPAGTTITAVNAAEGKLTLSANVEAGGSGIEVPIKSGLAYNATAAQVQTALQGLSTIGSGAAIVTGGPGATAPYTVSFAGALANLPMPLLVADSSELTGGSVAASITTPGKSAFEICKAGVDTCKAGTNVVTAGGLQQVMSVAVDQTTGNVYATGNISHRVDVFSAEGAYQGSFGLGVRVGDAAPFGLDFCNASTGCVAGQTSATAGLGAAAGAQASSPESRTMTVDSAGNLYLPDPGNRRLDLFAPVLNGSNEVIGANFVKAIGADLIPSGAEGTATVTSGSTTVTNVDTTKKAFRIGQRITGTGIAPNTTIASVSESSLTLSQAATSVATGAGTTISVAEGPGNVSRNEKQTVTLPAGTTGGAFTLTFKVAAPSESAATTAAIPFEASAGEVEAKLGALSNLGVANVAVSGAGGGPWTVEFKGARFADTNVEQMTANGSGLAPAGSVSVATLQNGTALETCTVTSTCQIGAAGPDPGWFNSESPNSVAVDSSNNIYTVTYKSSGNCEAAAPCRIQRFNPDGTVATSTFGPSSGGTSSCQVNFTSGVGNEEEALAVAVDPSNQHVFALKKTALAGARICELGSDGSFDGESISPETDLAVFSGTPQGPGLAVLLGRVYAADRTAVYILASVPSPAVKILPAANVTGTTAELRGQVTVPPGTQGIAARYHFEYSGDYGLHWTKVPTPDALVPGGTVAGTYDVQQTATGLQPNSNYVFRLMASTSQSVTSGEEVFTTTAAPPSVTESSAVGAVTSTSGRLSGTVNPNNSPTTYRFEYGTTTSYGSQSPAELEPFVGSGGVPVPVTATLSGLDPNTTYHWRIVATNPAGKTVGDDQQFTTYEEPEPLNSAGLPDNRAVELVTPPDKRPVGVVAPFINKQIRFQAAGDGERIGYPVLNGLPHTTSGGETIYAAKRSAAGWASSEVSAPSLLSSAEESPESSRVRYFSPEDLKCAVVESIQPLTADTPAVDVANGVTNLYRWNSADGTYTLVTNKIPLNPAAVEQNSLYYQVAGASGNCLRIIFRSSTYNFIPGASGVYEWDDGTLRDALPPVTADVNLFAQRQNIVSPDGRFFFTATSNQPGDLGKQAIFVRKSPTETVDASLPTPGKGATNGANYETASPDGSHVFFLANYGIASTSSNGPTNGACQGKSEDTGQWSTTPCDLYGYNVGTGELTDISADTNGADTNGAVVQGVMDVSGDGSVVYFAALGQLVPGKGRTYAGNQVGIKHANVYRYKSGALTYVGSVASRDLAPNNAAPKGSVLVHNPKNWTSQSNRTGGYFLFVSHDNMTGTNPAEVEEAYLFSAATGAAECVSCPADGSAPHAAGSGVLRTPEDLQARTSQPSALSEDGRVVFTAEDALTPDAVEGHGAGANQETEVFENNIYEWHQGQVSLLASGQAQALGMGGPDGRDVFLRTTARLAPQDFDFGYDIYDLRSGGGFATPPEPPAPCDPAADQCQGIPSSIPAAPTGATGATGPGNPQQQQPRCRKGFVRKKGKCVRKHHRRRHTATRTNADHKGGAK